eukprot:1842212-Pyramimonas_sp.AAC.1
MAHSPSSETSTGRGPGGRDGAFASEAAAAPPPLLEAHPPLRCGADEQEEGAGGSRGRRTRER